MKSDDQSFDPLALRYDFMASLDRTKNDFFLSNLSHQRQSALDIRCGSGVLVAELAHYYKKIIGIDMSEQMLAIERAKRSLPNTEYILMDANCIDLPHKFDLICSAYTFHHLQDVPKSLEITKNLLNPGGRIVILDSVIGDKKPSTWIYLVSAAIDFMPDCKQYGIWNAIRAFRFKTSPSWLNHRASDRYMSGSGFRTVFGHALPGCEFISNRKFLGVLWQS
jgi:ubiquinone/menaquinone biosynthesis C-methylase UbiE